MIANGEVFGKDQKLILVLLDIPMMMGVLNGVVMELADCAFPLLTEVIPTDDPAVGFKDVSAAFLVGSMPRREGMERKDLLSANVKIFKVQGEALDNYAKKDVKVLVVGNPANTNALVCSHYAPSIPRENFTAMTRLDQNRARAQIAQRLKTDISNVKNLIIWGNHSGRQSEICLYQRVTLIVVLFFFSNSIPRRCQRHSKRQTSHRSSRRSLLAKWIHWNRSKAWCCCHCCP